MKQRMQRACLRLGTKLISKAGYTLAAAAEEFSGLPRHVRMFEALGIDTVIDVGAAIYLKIDTQGYESEVLKGAERALAQIDTVELEMSLVPLYKGQLLFCDL